MRTVAGVKGQDLHACNDSQFTVNTKKSEVMLTADLARELETSKVRCTHPHAWSQYATWTYLCTT